MKKLIHKFRQRYAAFKAKRAIRRRNPESKELAKRLFLTVNRYLFVLLGILLVYFFLLLLLVEIEKSSPDATIHNIGQAIWYSLATFTTVGYGDFYPVTPAGRAIASIFLVLGIGLLGFFVGFMVDFISHMRPVIALSINAGKPWYIFTDKSPYSVIFAENLKAVRPDALIIYAEEKADKKAANYISISWTVGELLERRGSIYDAHIMCMKENEMENFLDSMRLSDLSVPIICLANFTPSHHPMNINFFSLTDCTARIFWQVYPVRKKDEIILLIGFENAGSILLDRALELNVLDENQRICYHVFGDAGDYLQNRKRLSEIVSLNQASENSDSIFFHDDVWNSDEELLTNADRIVLCADSEKANILILHKLQKFFCVKAEIYIYNSNVRSVATPFGQTRDVLTPAFVLHNRLSDMALCRHELFRFYYGSFAGMELPMWENLNSLVKDLNYNAVDHITIKTQITLGEEAPCTPFDELEPEVLRKAAAVFNSADEKEKDRFRRLEHKRMQRFYMLHNYRYNETLDDDMRLNPLIAPYDQLAEPLKSIFDTSWALLDELAAHKEARRR